MGIRAVIALELRHNDEPVGRVCGGAVDVYYDVVSGDARFWLGLRGMASGVPFRRPPLPRPRAHFITLVVG